MEDYVVKDNHYVDTNAFRLDLIEYLNKRKINIKEKIPNSIGKAILAIANNLSKKGNFSGYTFRDEMVSDAVETCLKYMHNFDPDRISNSGPFSYFTLICYRAFIRRIKKEKIQFEIRRNIVKNLELLPDEELAHFQDMDSEIPYLQQYRDYLKEFTDHYDHIHS